MVSRLSSCEREKPSFCDSGACANMCPVSGAGSRGSVECLIQTSVTSSANNTTPKNMVIRDTVVMRMLATPKPPWPPPLLALSIEERDQDTFPPSESLFRSKRRTGDGMSIHLPTHPKIYIRVNSSQPCSPRGI